MASVRQRKGSKFWWACITLPTGKRSQFSTGKTEREEALEVAVRTERETLRHREEGKLRAALSRVADDVAGSSLVDPAGWLRRWAESKKPEVAPATFDCYRQAMDSAGRFFKDRHALSDISIADVTAYRDHLGKISSTTTATTKLKVLRMALKDAWRQRLIAENVATMVPNLKREKGRTKRRAFSPAELLRTLAEADPTWRTMILLGLYTGQRMGDLATLQWRHVDLAAGVISREASKTGASIILPIVTPLQEALEALPSSDDPAAFLFPDLATMEKDARSKRFRRVLWLAGLVPKRNDKVTGQGRKTFKRVTNELGFHSLRHTATTLLKAAGVSGPVAQAIIGHESEAVSRVYTHMPLETMREALEKIVPKSSGK